MARSKAGLRPGDDGRSESDGKEVDGWQYLGKLFDMSI
jgi:hypothetical protein